MQPMTANKKNATINLARLFLLQASTFFYFQTEWNLPNATEVWDDLK